MIKYLMLTINQYWQKINNYFNLIRSLLLSLKLADMYVINFIY